VDFGSSIHQNSWVYAFFLGEGDRLLDVWEALFDSSDSRILFNGEVI